MRSLKMLALAAGVVGLGLTQSATMQSITDAPTGFDNLTNGHTDQATFDLNKEIFDEIEDDDEGLGPVFNMRGCGECHGNPVIGAASQIAEQRAGHFDGVNFISHPGDSLIHSQSIDPELQEHILDGNEVRTFRISLSTMGDGFVEAITAGTFGAIQAAQPLGQRGTIINVPVLEDNRPNVAHVRIGRFGHKNQQASLLDFSGDAYLNEMGITNCVPGEPAEVAGNLTACNFATENTSNGNSVEDADEVADPEDGGEDVQAFADFMRSLKAPDRGTITTQVTAGEGTFNSIGCAVCHTPSIVTAAPGTIINGVLPVSAALGNKRIRPFGDYMLHNVGTGDGIVQNGGQATRNMVRTAPLWGVRARNRLMHDGLSLTFTDAILRHAGQATTARNNFANLGSTSRANVIAFLKSL
jgi:CxxC motif-containing protein (DUF1111 family)